MFASCSRKQHWRLLLKNIYLLNSKYQNNIKRKAIPKKQPKKINAVLKKGPKKPFQRLARFSGFNLAAPQDIPVLDLRDAPQWRQNLSSRSIEFLQLGQCADMNSSSFNSFDPFGMIPELRLMKKHKLWCKPPDG
jgi:hypothetical protein